MMNEDMHAWMQQQGYLDMWILPINGYNDGTMYANRPVGDSPEMMPLDSSLFEYLHAGVHHHVSITSLLENDNLQKFSLAISKQISHCYTHLFKPAHGTDTGIPTSKRIIQDFKKFVSSCLTIQKAQGVVVLGLGSRNGHQKENVQGQMNNHGGRHMQKPFSPSEQPWVHPEKLLLHLLSAASQWQKAGVMSWSRTRRRMK